MVIRIRNGSQGAVRFRDYYSETVSETGYYGAINYKIPGDGGRMTISSSVFTKEITKNLRYPQEIRVLREDGGEGEVPPLILFHYQFDNNDGCDLLLETDAQNQLTCRFAPPNVEGSLLHKIWFSILPSAWCSAQL